MWHALDSDAAALEEAEPAEAATGALIDTPCEGEEEEEKAEDETVEENDTQKE